MADKPMSLDNYVVSDDDLSQYVIEPLGMQTQAPDDRTLYQRAAQGATEAIRGQGGNVAGGLASFVIPQNEAELGMMAGTAGAQGVVNKLGMKGFPAALARVLGAASGGEAGGQYAGQPTGQGAAVGALAGATGETVLPTAGWLARSAPGMKGYINRKRSAEIGKIIEDRVPPLSGARDPHALDQMARDFEQGKGSLLDYYAALTDAFEKKLGSRRLNIPELVEARPSTSTQNVTFSELVDKPYPPERTVTYNTPTMMTTGSGGVTDIEGKIVPGTPTPGTVRSSSAVGGPPRDPVFGFAPKEQVLSTTPGTVTSQTVNSAAVYDPVYNPQGGVSIRQVMDELKKAGHYGYGGSKSNPNARTIVGEEPRMEYGALLKKTQDELNRLEPSGELTKEFMENRGTAAAGFTLLKMLQGGRSFNRYPRDVQLNIPFLQEYVNQNQTEIQKKIGDQAFAKLEQVLWRGGKRGTRDIPSIGAGGSQDVALDALGGAGGSPRALTAPLRMILPNLRAQYAGRQPYSPSGGARALMDMLLQRGAAPFARKENTP